MHAPGRSQSDGAGRARRAPCAFRLVSRSARQVGPACQWWRVRAHPTLTWTCPLALPRGEVIAGSTVMLAVPSQQHPEREGDRARPLAKVVRPYAEQHHRSGRGKLLSRRRNRSGVVPETPLATPGRREPSPTRHTTEAFCVLLASTRQPWRRCRPRSCARSSTCGSTC